MDIREKNLKIPSNITGETCEFTLNQISQTQTTELNYPTKSKPTTIN